MICQACGNLLPNNAKFCGLCGSAVQERFYERSYSQDDSQDDIPSDYVITDPYHATKNALADIRQTPGWIKRILLLALMNSLPILNFFASGYAIRWATTAWKNVPHEMPRYEFNKDAFLMGLFATLIGWLTQIGTAWLIVCNIIPIAGTILWIALLVNATVFSALAVLRMAAFNRFGAAFDMSEIFKKLRIKSSGLLKSYWIPWLICIGIIFAMILATILISTLVGLMIATAANQLSDNSDILIVFSVAFSRAYWLFIILSICSALTSWFLVALTTVWSYRSLGHWFGYYAYDWVCDIDAEKKRD